MTQSHPQPEPKKFQITVVHNGIAKPLEAQPNQSVKAVLAHAIQLFNVAQNPHMLSLFREDGTEVDENKSAAEAGLQQGVTVHLRPSAVKGG